MRAQADAAFPRSPILIPRTMLNTEEGLTAATTEKGERSVAAPLRPAARHATSLGHYEMIFLRTA